MAGFTSTLYPGEQVIHDSTAMDNIIVPGMGRGLDLSLKGPFSYGASADDFPDELLVPDSEVEARIKEAEETKTRLSDLMNQAGLPCKNQQNTNYCWINAPTHCVEIIRVIQNQPMVILSPASVGGPMTNFQNVGGWGGPGLAGIFARGLCPVNKWPANAIDRSYWTEENKALALHYRQTEWWELKPRNLRQLVSLLLRRIPVAGGYNWWSHEITNYEPVWIDGAVAIRIRNSWGDVQAWPNGYGILQGSKMLPDDQVAPRTAIAA